jgi:methanogenic corrinoid protein MtbC1
MDAPGADTVRARAYLTHLLERQQARAVDVLLDAVRSGRTVAEVYETVITPALGEVGRMWHLGEATVADEHYVTAATQSALAVLRSKLPQAERHGKRALAASVGGDLHDIGIRMVADLLESEGWQVDCLGANMPTVDLVEHAVDEMGRQQFHLIALSASTGLAVRAIAGAIEALRAASPEARTPVMVGGGVFALVPDLWKVVGADGCATSASDSVRVARALVG